MIEAGGQVGVRVFGKDGQDLCRILIRQIFLFLETDFLEQKDLKDDPEMKDKISEMYEKYSEIINSKRSVPIE